MNMKNGNIIPAILMTLLMIACCSEPTYEITIIDIESRALILDGINVIEFDKQNSIDKDEFVIEIDIIEQEEIASSEFLNHKDGDTKVSRAAVVPCADQVLIYKNNIKSIKVEVLDVGTDNERIDITNQLVIVGTQTSISQYISQNPQGIGYFLVQFSDTSNIPGRIEYVIEANLDDGTIINAMNGVIIFN
jgi:hypothetical protein